MKRFKLLSTILVFVLFLSSCSTKQKEETGVIQDIEVTTIVNEEESIFEKEDNDLGYVTKNISDLRAECAFEIPSNWEVNELSGRAYTISSQSNDPLLPNISLNVYRIYGTPQTEFVDAFSMRSLFENELLNGTYIIEGKRYKVSDLPSPDEIIDDPTYAKNSATVSFQFHRDLTMIEADKTKVMPEPTTIINAYINWYGIPTLISVACSEDKEETAYKELRYITSSMTKVTPRIDSQKEYSIGNKLKLTLPSEFIIDGSEVHTTGLSPLSGIALGVYHYPNEVTEDILSDVIPTKICNIMNIQGSAVPAIYPEDKDISIGGKPVKCFTGSSSYIAKNSSAYSYYGNGGNINYKIYAIPYNNTNYILILLYENGQEELASNIGRLIETKTYFS